MVVVALAASLVLPLVSISAGNVVAQQLLSRIVGEVTDDGGEPIAGIDVTARNAAGDVLYSGVTAADGGYALDLTNTWPDGEGYSVEFIDSTGTYAADVFSSVFIQPGYDALLSVSLQPGVQVIGTVLADSGAPVVGACVRIFPYDVPWVRYDASAACTDANGQFASIGFAPGRYAMFVRAGNLPYFSQYFADGDIVTLAAPVFDAGTITLAPRTGNTITGTVVSEGTGEPVPSCVDYYEAGSDPDGVPAWSTCSATGDFETIPFPAGTRNLYLSPTDGVHLAANQAVTVGDAPVSTELQVAVGGTISGSITTVGGVPQGATVQACYLYPWCAKVGEPVTVDPLTGEYEITGLDSYPSEVVVQFAAPGHETEFWDGDRESPDVRAIEAAAPISVGPGIDVEGISAILETRTEGSISGTVTIDQPGLDDSNPLENATIHVYGVDDPQVRVASAATAADGSYVVDQLVPGDYYVEAVAIGYLTERFDDVGNGEALATVVSVTDAAGVNGIDLALEPEGVITGVAAAEPGAYVTTTDMYCVTATPLAPLSFAARSTCARIGQPYRISKLPTGSYEVRFTSANFNDTSYANVGESEPTPVEVVTPSVTAGIDVVLVQKPIISGTLTGSDGAAIANGSLTLYLPDGSYVSNTTSKADGTYRFATDPGSYRIYASGSQGYNGEYYNDTTDFAAAAPIDVDDTTDRTDIDIVLQRRPSISGTMTPCGYAQAIAPDYSRSFSGSTRCNGDTGNVRDLHPTRHLPPELQSVPCQASRANGGTGPTQPMPHRSPSTTATTPPDSPSRSTNSNGSTARSPPQTADRQHRCWCVRSTRSPGRTSAA